MFIFLTGRPVVPTNIKQGVYGFLLIINTSTHTYIIFISNVEV